MRKIKNPKPSEYVLVTKYSDHDLGDPWALGWFSRKGDYAGETTYYIKDENGKESDYPKYRHCFRLTIEEGKNLIYMYNKNY